ncbi:hypothetical protein [Streptococcus sanguinis]|nr:hypothetical protein [Streptococcus sanguinis]MCC3173863.1 hypothetical protein [Streptococcus sanguinis]
MNNRTPKTLKTDLRLGYNPSEKEKLLFSGVVSTLCIQLNMA